MGHTSFMDKAGPHTVNEWYDLETEHTAKVTREDFCDLMEPMPYTQFCIYVDGKLVDTWYNHFPELWLTRVQEVCEVAVILWKRAIQKHKDYWAQENHRRRHEP